MMLRFEKYKSQFDIILLNDSTLEECVRKGSCLSSCLKCSEPKCFKLDSELFDIDELEDFSYDRDDTVCPVEAISFNNGYPIIDQEKCIMCGLCISVCPACAVCQKEDKLIINKDLTPLQYVAKPTKANLLKQSEQIKKLMTINYSGNSIAINSKSLKLIQDKLNYANSSYHNKIVRNLLIGLGCKATVPRTGDNANRMDGVFTTENGEIGVVEVEFGTDSLSTARGLLDDIAMLQYKQNIKKEKIRPLAVLLSMPNKRGDYWNVIQDIKKETGILINTITIAALMVLLWKKKKLDFNTNPYYIDVTNPSIKKQIEKHINEKIKLPTGFMGIFEPEK